MKLDSGAQGLDHIGESADIGGGRKAGLLPGFPGKLAR
jgi:hypothetical protein